MISIIGAGPAGSYLASLLAKKDVAVFEEHKTIGKPVQCTGITTQALAQALHIKNRFLVNTVTNVRIFSPNNKSFDLRLSKPNLIIDRAEFDSYLSEKAQDKGAKLYTGHKYKSCSKKGNRLELEFEDGKKIMTDILVGADGPFSKVAQTTGLWNDRKFAVGAQARVKMPVDSQTVEFYVQQESFGWVVPESSETARVGIATYDKPRERFDALLKRRNITEKQIIGYQSGMIPVHNPKAKTQKENVYLLGDAATHVKATTFGGIVQGLFAAEELSKAILHGQDYEKLWKKRIGRDLKISLMIRNKLDKMTDEKYNWLVELFGQERLKKVLETKERDYPSRFALELLVKEPRLLQLLF